MRYVDTTFCSEVERTCKKSEYSKSNHITLCHEFAPGTKCASPERRQRYCIDEYEYPNEKGAHPPVMVDWYDAEAACEAKGKRLCYESEWVAACEGPDKLPFPAGLTRDPAKCNIDNTWTEPRLKAVYSSNRATQNAELARLDQSLPSGAKEGCVSGFGVRDLTGNVDEWVISEKNRGRSKWAGLKGGAWGHVRNACRPITFSHPPEFTYYFISFRCCADPKLPAEALAKPAADGVPVWRPPPVPAKKKPGPISKGVTPTK
jgi:formylglycine-generating enzyme required for sulfatase activity